MIDILKQTYKYVPAKVSICKDPVTQKDVRNHPLHEILFGGDQLTRKRAQTAKDMLKNSITPSELKA